ncbi:MAG: LD-carboxypeptidase [Alicyclobacillus sp.]|nr:LD-carboxypeptidase [Alicyclobacillus sp.]
MLREGDTVGIAAPAHPFYPAMEPFLQLGCNALRALGLRVKFAQHALTQSDMLAIPAEQRASDLNDLFADPDVKAIFCLSGGANTNAVLPLLDWAVILQNPKIIMGYSANTALLLGIYSQTNMVTFHGPHVVLDGLSEYPKPLEYTLRYIRRLMFHADVVGRIEAPNEWTDDFPRTDKPRQMKENRPWRWVRPGQGQGRLLGGNLSAMRTIAGTKFWPSFRSAILFVEEVYMGSPILKDIDDSLTHLKLLGVFDEIAGLVVGKINNQSVEEEQALERLVVEHTKEYRFPVLMGVDIGHTDPQLILPIGIHATLDSERDCFSFDEGAVLNS